MKKMFILGLLIVSSAINSFAEKHSVGIVLQPKFIYAFGQYKNPSLITKLSYDIGIRYSLKIGAKLNLDSRLLLSNSRFSIDTNKYELEDFGDPVFEQPIIEYSIKSISIPVTLNYEVFSKNKYSIGVRGGVSFDKYFNTKAKVFGEKKTSKMDIKDYGFSGIIGVPIKYLLNDKLSLVIEPQFNRDLVEIHETKTSTPSFYSFGINFGVSMRL